MGRIRSVLFVPGHKEKMVVKSVNAESETDGVVWDIEDAVPPSEKPAARQLIGKTLQEGLPAKPVYVRVNALATKMTGEDLRAVVYPGLYAVMVPKVESKDDITAVSALLETLEQERGITEKIKIHAIVETCLGVLKALEIVTSSDRIEGVSFGAEDFTLDLGTSRSREGIELAHARGLVVLAGAAAKVNIIDTVFSDLNDEEGLANECRGSRQMGFLAKFAIHPKQVPVINAAFSPTQAEIDFATRVVEAFAKAQAENIGVITVDGKMIDPPVVERARKLLASTK
ncbi:MAG: CoA ester lyase [Peptococcaceae bacterium]|nr:CoA ester lyase [Peptococcaceae bacterium]